MDKFLDEIICGDCIEILSGAKQPFADLIFADPPFNIGYKYDKYYDKVKKKNYIAWTAEWMKVCKKVLKPHGSFYIAIGDDYAANVKIIADEIGLFMRNWIIWHYTFGQQTKDKFARAHTHIFYFVNDKKNYTFNDRTVRVPSDRQLLYNDKRANPIGKMPDDVWNGYSRVCGTFKERLGWHPCQMPEHLLKRIISVSSNPGDCVLDPFSGSGTTAVSAASLARHYVGIDISKQYVEKTKERLKKLYRIKREENLFTQNQHGLKSILQTNLQQTLKSEMQRLSVDMCKALKEIYVDENLLKLFVNQLQVRMGNEKIKSQEIIAAIKELSY